MDKKTEACIESICSFPILYKKGNQTPLGIIKECEYVELFSIITVELISKYLETNQNLIEDWIQFSEDIRHSPAWGFGQDKKGEWLVVFSDMGQQIESYSFDNRIDACAKMIKMTVEEIRTDN